MTPRVRFGNTSDGSCDAMFMGCQHGPALAITMDHMIVRLCVSCFITMRDDCEMLLDRAREAP